MTVLREGNLQITFPAGVGVRKFDDGATHGLSHCMKAVDFIIELADRLLFIEIKDPDDPKAKPDDIKKFVARFLSGSIDEDLKYKYRDSFIFEWASGRTNKPIYYLVLVAIETLTEAELLDRTDDLKRKLPVKGPSSGEWRKAIVEGCSVFNVHSWNKTLARYPVTRNGA